jgi:hypothetical protein
MTRKIEKRIELLSNSILFSADFSVDSVADKKLMCQLSKLTLAFLSRKRLAAVVRVPFLRRG